MGSLNASRRPIAAGGCVVVTEVHIESQGVVATTIYNSSSLSIQIAHKQLMLS